MSSLSHKEFWLKYGLEPELLYTDGEGHLLTKSQALKNTRFKYINGELVEIMVCSAPVFNADGFETLATSRRVARSRDREADPETLRRSRERARRRLTDLIWCNGWRYFVTLTFDEQKIDRTNYDEIIKKINVYLDNRVRRSGWKYAGVVEYHKDHRGLHFHFLVDGDLKLVDSGTVSVPGHKRPIRRDYARRLGFSESEMKTVYNIVDWSLGFSTAIAVYGDRRALARYVGKYLTKSEVDKIGGRWYYRGGSLDEPMYKYDNTDFDRFVGDVDFDTDGGWFKIAYFDR